MAAATWVLLTARVVTSIPHVRSQIARLHGRSPSPATTVAADGAALGLAAAAVAIDRHLAAGAMALAVLVVVQRAMARRPVDRAVTVGVRQMAMGFVVVVAAAVGVLATAP